MNVLLLRLAGPMQSWGVQSRYKERDTGLEPSKSGVVGLLCAALGRKRYESIKDLRALTMGVRVDQEGTMLHDYQTAQNVRVASAKSVNFEKGTGLRSSTSNRYYLADARFLVGLEGDDLDLLTQLHAALRDPHWPLYLGRKAFVPGEPVWLENGLQRDTELLEALKDYHWLGCDRQAWEEIEQVRVVLEDSEHGTEVRPDQPISFAERRFAPRRVTTTFIDKPPFEEVEPCISLD
jgi:CRISPR system Cascade subunit CasD